MIVMIFAAGLGKRLKPLTDRMPKALVPIGGKPLLQIQLDKLYAHGVRRVIVNVHHFADMMVDYINQHHRDGLEIIVSNEKDKLLDTGGGLKKAGKMMAERGMTEPIVIHNVDILDNADLDVFYKQLQPGVDAVLMVNRRQTKRYLLFDDDMRLVGWTNVETGEVKTPYLDLDVASCRKLAFTGMHVVGQNVFKAMDSMPDVFSIIDFYVSQCKSLVIKGYVPDGLKIIDVGKIGELEHAEMFYKENY